MGSTKRGLVVASVLAALAASPAQAASSAVEQALRTAFESADRNHDGVLTASEVTRYTQSLFAAMDTDGNGRVTAREFHGVGLGLLPIARQRGRVEQYAAARERIRRRWTLTGRRTLSPVNLLTGVRGELFAAARGRGRVSFAQFRRARFVRELAASVR